MKVKTAFLILVLFVAVILFVHEKGLWNDVLDLLPYFGLKGKFVFTATRQVNPPKTSLHLWKKGRVRFLGYHRVMPVWSPDGKYIACRSLGNEIYLVGDNGKTVKTLKTPYFPSSMAWKSREKLIYKGIENRADPVNSLKALYELDINSGETKKLLQLAEGEDIINLSVSPDGNKILFILVVSDEVKNPIRKRGIYLVNSDGTQLRLLSRWGTSVSWFPDSKHILYANTRDEKGNRLDVGHGYYFKKDINSGKDSFVRRILAFETNTKVSPDGNYIYASSGLKGRGRCIVVYPLKEEESAIMITEPVEIAHDTYSQDDFPDWYQGN